MSNIKKIYFDYSATTPVDPEVLAAMLPYYKENFGNASSIHNFGYQASKGVEKARETVAKFLNCEDEEIIFTSGATESNNLAILGVGRALKQKYSTIDQPHIITSKIEHPAILEPCRKLEQEGFEITYLSPNKRGLVELEKISKAIKNNTVLLSIMYVNNEVGTIQPIGEVGKLIKKANYERGKKRLPRIYFHTDAVQAVNYCDCDVKKLNVDLLSLSGHKVYGPKGVGALYIKKDTFITPIIVGGHQEKNIRSGTYNSPGIVGLGKAIELLQSLKYKKQLKEIKKLRDYLIKRILNEIPSSQLNGDLEQRVAGNANFSLIGAEGESMLIMLDMEGIAVSTGSACSSGSLKPSHVLLAMGIPPEICHNSLRITLGKFTTKQEIDYVVDRLKEVVKKLREMAPKE
jgi:cysteine desulfurase